MTTQNSSSPSPTCIGVLILGRKRPGFDREWNQIVCRRSLDALRSLGFTCIGAETPVIDDASLRLAFDRIHAGDCAALLVLQPSMGNGQLSLSIGRFWPGPILLWATPERPEGGKVSSCSLVGQHLWASILRQAGHPFELIYGDAEDPATRAALIGAVALAHTALRLRRAKAGLIGGYVPGFVDIAADPFLLRRSIGVQLHSLSLPQFIDRVQAIGEDDLRRDLHRVRELRLPMVDVTDDDLALNSRYYLAMRETMREESLDALAIQCWPELPNFPGQWPYLAISRLSSEGCAVAMEGDVDASITSLMGLSLGLGPGFLTDWLEHDETTIFFWHPGMAPLSMCSPIGSSDGPALGRHFNIVKPLVVDGPLRSNEPITVTRLWRCDNQYHMTAFEGTSLPVRRKVSGNTALVEFTGQNIPRRFDRLLHGGMPHHVSLFFGHSADAFERLARLLGIHWYP